jgi:hypothetical protein
MQNPIWFLAMKKGNRIPDIFSFVLLRNPKRKYSGMTPVLNFVG